MRSSRKATCQSTYHSAGYTIHRFLNIDSMSRQYVLAKVFDPILRRGNNASAY